jgi:hypothetical protein
MPLSTQSTPLPEDASQLMDGIVSCMRTFAKAWEASASSEAYQSLTELFALGDSAVWIMNNGEDPWRSGAMKTMWAYIQFHSGFLTEEDYRKELSAAEFKDAIDGRWRLDTRTG